MGVPFPAGLRALAHRGEGMLAWAQAAGALASVVASLLAAPLAMLVGFRAELLLAALLYGAAARALRTAGAPASAGDQRGLGRAKAARPRAPRWRTWRHGGVAGWGQPTGSICRKYP